MTIAEYEEQYGVEVTPSIADQIVSGSAVLAHIKATTDILEREQFIVLTLDTSSRVINTHVLFVGTLNSCVVHPRDIFRTAILDNACSVIVLHNHPSGDPTPSKEDRAISQRISEAGELLGIRVLDSLVVGKMGWRSVLH